MDKHEAMVLQNKVRSTAKVNTAISIIKNMVKENEQVVVCRLVEKTGFSRSFFYSNACVREELNRAQELQKGKSFVAPQKAAIDKALDKENKLLNKMLAEKDKKIDDLEKENAKLKKAVKENQMKIINAL